MHRRQQQSHCPYQSLPSYAPRCVSRVRFGDHRICLGGISGDRVSCFRCPIFSTDPSGEIGSGCRNLPIRGQRQHLLNLFPAPRSLQSVSTTATTKLSPVWSKQEVTVIRFLWQALGKVGNLRFVRGRPSTPKRPRYPFPLIVPLPAVTSGSPRSSVFTFPFPGRSKPIAPVVTRLLHRLPFRQLWLAAAESHPCRTQEPLRRGIEYPRIGRSESAPPPASRSCLTAGHLSPQAMLPARTLALALIGLFVVSPPYQLW